MRMIPYVLLLGALALAMVGIAGEFRGGLWFVAMPSKRLYSEDLLATWNIANFALALTVVVCLVLWRSGSHPLILRMLGYSALFAFALSLTVGYGYYLLTNLAILGNGSDTWQHMKSRMPFVFTRTQGVGGAIGLIASILHHLLASDRNTSQARRAGI